MIQSYIVGNNITVIIKSDNKDYPDITVSADEANQKIFIVGKVIERSGVI